MELCTSLPGLCLARGSREQRQEVGREPGLRALPVDTGGASLLVLLLGGHICRKVERAAGMEPQALLSLRALVGQ